jgi:hypothetical protein
MVAAHELLGLASARDLVGFVASALVLGAFLMRDMLILRLLAILSNLAFIAYAVVAGWVMPVLVLHVALLPVNICRLSQQCRMRRSGPSDTRALRVML